MVTRLMFVSEAPSRIGWIHYALLTLRGQRCGQVNVGGPWGHMDFALPMWMCIPLLIAGLFDLEQRHGAAAATGNNSATTYSSSAPLNASAWFVVILIIVPAFVC